MRLIQQPVLQWVNPTRNTPVGQGFMYFGEVGQDPKIPANQITVYRKNQLNEYVEVQQPISLSDSGVPIYLGQEMALYVDQDCSIRVDDRSGYQQYLIREYFTKDYSTGIVNIDTFGADDDFSSALEDAVSYAAENKGLVVGTAGKTYQARRQIAYTDPDFINIDLSMCKVIRAADFTPNEAAPTNPYSAAPILDIVYTHTNVIDASGPLTTVEIDFTGDGSGNTTCSRMPVASSAGYAKDDVVRIYSDDLIPWGTGASPSGDDEYLGQDAVIARVNATSIDFYGKLDFQDFLITRVKLAKKTARPCTVSINCSDPDGYYDNPTTEAKYRRNRSMVRITGAVLNKHPSLKFEKCMSMGLETNACYMPLVEQLECEYLRTSSTYFAVGYGWQSRDTYPTLKTPINGRMVRHMHTSNAGALPELTEWIAGGGVGPYPEHEAWQYGGMVRGIFHGGNLSGGEHAPHDFHADAFCCTVINPKSNQQVRGPSAGQSCVQLRGTGHSVLNMDATGGGGVSIIPTGTGSNYSVTGKYTRPEGITSTNFAVGVSDNGLATKPKVSIQMDLDIADTAGPLFSLANAEVNYSGNINWKYTGASSARVFSLTKTNLDADISLDVRGATGTNLRIVRFEDALSTAKYTAEVMADGNFIAADFQNNASSCYAEIDTRLIDSGRLATTSFANAPAGCKKVLKVIERTVDNVTYTTAGNKTITYVNQYEQVTNIRLAATVAGVAINALPRPYSIGQTAFLTNTKAGGTQDITLNNVPGLIEIGGSPVVIHLGSAYQLVGDPITGIWVSA